MSKLGTTPLWVSLYGNAERRRLGRPGWTARILRGVMVLVVVVASGVFPRSGLADYAAFLIPDYYYQWPDIPPMGPCYGGSTPGGFTPRLEDWCAAVLAANIKNWSCQGGAVMISCQNNTFVERYGPNLQWTATGTIVPTCQLPTKEPFVAGRWWAAPSWVAAAGACSCPTSDSYLFDKAIQWCVAVDPICVGPGCTYTDKNKGPPAAECCVSNPIDAGFGNKFQREVDIAGPVALIRSYNGDHQGPSRSALGRSGVKWTGDFENRLEPIPPIWSYGCYRRRDNGQVICEYSQLPTSPGPVRWTRADGSRVVFDWTGSGYVATGDIADQLIGIQGSDGTMQGWQLTSANGDRTEFYDASGLLLSSANREGQGNQVSYADGAGGILYTASSTVAPGSPLGYVAPTCAIAHPPLTGGGSGTAGVFVPKGIALCVTDPFGRQNHYQYGVPGTGAFDPASRVRKVLDASGAAYDYEYDGASGGCTPPTNLGGCAKNNLTKVTYPDGASKTYYYNELANINGGVACPVSVPAGAGLANLPNHLTGIVDENGVRFATWKYDCQGRAVSGEHAGGVGRFTLSYATNANWTSSTTTMTDPLGTVRTYGFQTILGAIKNISITGPAGPQYGPAAQTFDANGNLASRTDWNGNRTDYLYDLATNLETSRVEALAASGTATAQTRTIRTQWHASWRLPARVAEPLRITSYAYNGDAGVSCGYQADGTTPVPGVLCAKTVQGTSDASGSQGFGATETGAPRTWRYTYNQYGQILMADGPRTDVSDVTTYAYYADDDPDLGKRGNLASITNALGQVTSITGYNANAQPLTIVDPNGLVTQLSYDARQRLTSRDVGGEITSYSYDGVGQLTRVAPPDGASLAYTYDGARRLTGLSDNLGNRIAYTLDAMGNRTQEQVIDPAGNLAQTRSRVYSNLNRLAQEIGAQSQSTRYAYDNQGNLTAVTDPLDRVTSNAYDALNRLVRVTDPGSGQTQYGYNGRDQLASVTDPRSLVTAYAYDGLSNLGRQVSPDTGTTLNTFDAAGNLLTQTDAMDQVTTYAYDALNRVTSITFQDGAKQTYAYDQGANGIGRLSSISETDAAGALAGQTRYGYDQKGRVVSELRSVAGTAYTTEYSYDAAGRLAEMTYPSGRTVSYSFDALGRISRIATAKGPSTQTVVADVAYQPFGGVKSYTLGNGQRYTRSYDLDGRIAAYSLGANQFTLGFDAASRITSIAQSGSPSSTNTYGYDALDRLTQALLPNQNFGYAYDAVGNRQLKSAGAATELYSYAPTSNQLVWITSGTGARRDFWFDANGSTLADGANQYAYDARGRLVRATSVLGTTDYQVNALGQRVRKANPAGDTVFHYDTRGRLIAESGPGGALRREYLYLNDLPVAVIQ